MSVFEEILECLDNETTDWMNSVPDSKWYPVTKGRELVSAYKDNGVLVKAFQEVRGQRSWTNSPSDLADFVDRKAKCLFLATIFEGILPLIDQLCSEKVGDDEFIKLAPKWEGNILTFNGKPDTKLVTGDSIPRRKIQNLFYTSRWKFLVPVLKWKEFNAPAIASTTVLPFCGKETQISSSNFSIVEKVAVHKSYIDLRTRNHKIETNDEGHPYVVIKTLVHFGSDQENHKSFIKAEHETLEMLLESESEHLIKAIACYWSKDGYNLNFVLPFAQHGNLRTFWKERAPLIEDSEYMKWVFSQLNGLAWAIWEMHGDHTGVFCRHGDIKPENILCFESKEVASTKDQTSCVLVIADVGISRTHNKATEYRTRTKLEKADTILYAAPETELSQNSPTSRRADIWALGCLYLEFLIWLLYGNDGSDGLEKFSEDLGRNGKFYTNERDSEAGLAPGNVTRVNPVVKTWIRKVRNDPRCAEIDTEQTAVGRLLTLIEERMLHPKATPHPKDPASEDHKSSDVDLADDGSAKTNSEEHSNFPRIVFQGATAQPSENMTATRSKAHKLDLNERAYAQEVADILGNIIKDVNEGKIGYINTERQGIATDRRTDLAGSFENGNLQLNNEWNYVADKEVAQNLKAELDQLHHFQEPSVLCDRCCNLQLWSRNCSFNDTVANLTEKADKCLLCRLISSSLANWASLSNDRLNFFRVDSYLKLNNNHLPPILSLCTLPQAYDANEALKSNVQLGFPSLPNPGGTLQLKLIREWLRDCDTAHQCISSTGELPFLPTRLLDVGKPGSMQTQLICDTTILDARNVTYLALSHRWGPPRNSKEPDPHRKKFVRTFEKNINTIADGINDSEFPEKYQDAINIARGLKQQYLWIDSLCIIQADESDPDDKDKGRDFKKEAERMEMVFRSAYATLAASCSNSPEEHFLKPRQERLSVTMQAGKALYYLTNAIDDFNGDVESNALNKRGWVFQERALSRRTIHFTETQMYWECGEGVRCETLAKVKAPTPSFLSDAHFPSSLLEHGAGRSFELYQELYTRYSRLALSHITDRPVAIRGLETRLLSVLGTAGGYGVFENDLCRGLLWQRKEAHIDLIEFSRLNTGQGPVPSWSWMAYAGPIRYMDVPFEWTPFNDEITSPWRANGRTDKTELQCLVRDTHNIEPGVQIFLDNSYMSGRPFKCVVLGSSKMPDGSDKCYSLIVVPAGKGPGEEDVYVRAGAASLMHRHIVWESCAKARLL